jgi:hypothetical protein
VKAIAFVAFSIVCLFWAERAATQGRYEVSVALLAIVMIALTLGATHG